MEKTVKVRAMPEGSAPPDEAQSSKAAAELGIKNPQAELLKKIEQLENKLKEEQAKSATLADALKRISDMAASAAKS